MFQTILPSHLRTPEIWLVRSSEILLARHLLVHLSKRPLQTSFSFWPIVRIVADERIALLQPDYYLGCQGAHGSSAGSLGGYDLLSCGFFVHCLDHLLRRIEVLSLEKKGARYSPVSVMSMSGRTPFRDTVNARTAIRISKFAKQLGLTLAGHRKRAA